MDWFTVESPIGPLGVAVRDGAVTGVSFRPPSVPAVEPAATMRPARREAQVLAHVRAQFGQYFAGTRTDFELPLLVTRGSEFERAVWARIAAIPYGLTASYGEIARAVDGSGLGKGSASAPLGGTSDRAQAAFQAVGRACNRNPLPLIIPCHRIIGSDGKLVGFGGGLDARFPVGAGGRGAHANTPSRPA